MKGLFHRIVLFIFLVLPQIAWPQQVTVDSIAPLSGSIGTSVRIAGSNFDPSPANNIVTFGAVRAAVTSASSSGLDVLVPNGATYVPLTVTANGATTAARFPFDITFQTSGTVDSLSYAKSSTFNIGVFPSEGLAIGDIDGDGKPDVVVCNGGASTISILRNTASPGSIGAASFADTVDLPANIQPYKLVLADMDGDGKLDIVVVNRGFGSGVTLSVFRNESVPGTIAFAQKVDAITPVSPSCVAVGDLNGDGKPDIAMTTYGTDTISVFENTSVPGTVSIGRRFDFTAGAGLLGVAIGDLDGDGRPDMAIVNNSGNSVSIFRNLGLADSIAFAPRVDFPAGPIPDAIALADVDGDRKLDLVVVSYANNVVSVLRNLSTPGSIGPGSFAPQSDFATGTTPRSIAIDDLDGDGKPDFLLGNYNSTTVSVLRNTSAPGAVSFANRIDLQAQSNPLAVAIGDLDGDGIPDLVVSNNQSNSLSMFRSLLGDRHTIAASADTSGSISPSGSISILHGGSQTFAITPHLGYFISDVHVDSVTVGAPSSYLFSDVVANHTISAAFGIDTFAITASAGPHGLIAPAGTTIVPYGGTLRFSLRPDAGYHVDTLLIDGILAPPDTQYTFARVTAAHSIAARFAIDTFFITTVPPAHGSLIPSGIVGVTYGANQTFSVLPDTGYHLDSLVVDNLPLGPAANYTFSHVVSNHTIGARFSVDTFAITSTAGPHGSITPSGMVSVDFGESRTYSIIPDSGYHVDSVIVDGVMLGAETTYTFRTVATNHTIRATFSIDLFTIIASAGPHGSIAPSGTVTVAYGGNQTFTIVPAAGYHVDSVIVDGAMVGADTTYSFTGVRSNHVLAARFAIDAFVIAATAGPHGTITPSGSVTVDYGGNKTFAVVPDTGYHVDSLIVDGVPVAAESSYTFANVATNHAITAVFAIDLFSITATAGPHGMITPSGVVQVAYGGSQSYSIVADTGYHVDSLIVDGLLMGTQAAYAFTDVKGNHSIQARFSISNFTIAASAGPHGAITPAGSVGVSYGGNQTFTALPDTGYHIDSLIVDGVVVASESSYTFSNVTANHTIGVRFAIDRFTISATAGAHGKISPSGLVNVTYGGYQAFTMLPDPGYHVDSVLVDSVMIGAPKNYTFTKVSFNHTIGVKFALNKYTVMASAGPHGTISPTGTESVSYGGIASFTIIPDTGYHIDSVIVDGVMVGSDSGYTFTFITSDHSISARFAIDLYTIVASAGVNGRILPSGSVTEDFDASQSFRVEADTGYHVDSILVDGAFAGTDTQYIFSKITSDHSIKAMFGVDRYDIAASAGPNGTITPSGDVSVQFGDSLVFHFHPVSGYRVDSLLVDTILQPADSLYIFRRVAASHTIRVTFTTTTGISGLLNGIPRDYVLEQNYPNPFNPATTIVYGLPVEATVTLRIYDILGREYTLLDHEHEPAGYRSIRWNASEWASGVYFYRLEATGEQRPGRSFVQIKRMMLMK